MLPPQQPGLVLPQTRSHCREWKVKARNARNAHINTCYPHIAFQSLMAGPSPLSCFFLLERSWVFPAASKARGLKLAPTVSSCCCLLQADLTALSSHCPLTLRTRGKETSRPDQMSTLNYLVWSCTHFVCFLLHLKLNVSHKSLVLMNPWFLVCLEKLGLLVALVPWGAVRLWVCLRFSGLVPSCGSVWLLLFLSSPWRLQSLRTRPLLSSLWNSLSYL